MRMWLVCALCACLAGPAAAQDRAVVERQFQRWLQETIWPEARNRGVSRATFTSALSDVTLNWTLPDLAPPGAPQLPARPHSQAEFGAPGRYFNRGTVEGMARIGRQMASHHAGALARATRDTGVPAHVILAIWGRESGFGRVDIPHDAFEVLGTKGFMSTRAAYFTDELLALLEVAEAGAAPPGAMKSSWAGALGQPQFMPSNVLAYAADGDGDGRADIWRSEADTIASIARYLDLHGWVTGRDWGFEVRVPPGVSCTLEGPDQGRPIRDWAAMGITRASGRPFPDHEARGEGFLMMPAGRNGPAFVVTPNFYVLKAYNFSDLYALFVGHVGDRIAYDVGDFSAPWGPVGGLSRSDVARMQRALERMDHDVGGADGLAGFKTRRSIGRWQEAQGRTATCFPEASMKRLLR